MRRRELSPKFFLDDKLGALAPLSRLFYQGLWCEADREGRLVYEPRVLWAKVLPYDQWDPSLVQALEDARRVLPYEIDAVRYAWLPTLKKHQHFHPNEQASRLPRHPDDNSAEYQGKTKVLPKDHQGTPMDVPKDHQGTPLAPAKDAEGDPDYRTRRSYSSLTSLPSLPSGPSGETQEKIQIPPPPSAVPPVGNTEPAERHDDERATFDVEDPDDGLTDGEVKTKQPDIPYDAIVAAYHEKLPALAKCRSHGADSAVRKNIRARWDACAERQDLGWWLAYFADVAEMPWLMGEEPGRDGRPPFRATLGWLVLPTNMDKVLNGHYQRKAKPKATKGGWIDENGVEWCPGNCGRPVSDCWCEMYRQREDEAVKRRAAAAEREKLKGAPGAHD